MKRYRIILAVVLIPILLAAVVVGWMIYEMGQIHIIRYDKPLTLAEAKQNKLSFSFPSSAHDIYYALAYGGLQYHIEFIRFSASPEDCDQELAILSSEQREEFNRKEINLPLKTGYLDPINQEALAPLPWFHPEGILRGLKGESKNGNGPTLWIDQDNNNVYYYETD